MFKNSKPLLITFFLFLALSFDSYWAMEKNQVLPDEIYYIIFSFVTPSDLVYLPRVSKTWQKLVSQTLEFFPEKYLELCEVGFEKKKYSKILDPIFTNPTLYKKFIYYVLQASFRKNAEINEKARLKHQKSLQEKIHGIKSENFKDFFAIAWFAQEIPCYNSFQTLGLPEGLTHKRILAILISLGASLSIIKDVAECEEEYKVCYQLCRQCISSEFSEENFKAILKKLDENYIVANFIAEVQGENLGFSAPPLDFAVAKNNHKAVELLITQGFTDPNCYYWGRTPLLHACFKNMFNTVEFLIKNGANLSIKYPRGLLTESIAYYGNDYLEMFKLLVKHKAPLGDSLNIHKSIQENSFYVDQVTEYLEGLSLSDKTEGK